VGALAFVLYKIILTITLSTLTAFVRTSLPLGRLCEALSCINTDMFTFGREHEKKCEPRYVRNPEQVPLLLAVVDAVT
jgi:hypothetical protein